MRLLLAIRGAICAVLLFINALVIPFIIVLTALIQWIIPIKAWRRGWHCIINQLPTLWADANYLILRLLTGVTFQCQGADNLDKKTWYFLVANHRSWADILVLYYVFNRKAPPLKFFLKQQLIWVPGIGLACKALDFPFMQRYSKQYLKKHPEKRGKDIETTRRSCEAFKSHPSTIILFPEATRFTAEKQAAQQSAYQQLLTPRTGMVALSLSILGDYITHLLDITLAYDTPTATLWDVLCGRVSTISVHVNSVDIPDSIRNQLHNETELRQHTKQWLNTLWQEKDVRLQRFYASTK